MNLDPVTMAGQAECFVMGPLASALRVSRFVGLAPLTFAKTAKGWRVSLSPSLYAFGCLAVTVTNATIIWGMIMELHQRPANLLNMVMHRVTWMLEMVMVAMTWTVMAYSASSHMQCMIASLNQVQKIASKLNIHDWSPQWNKTRFGVSLSWMMIYMIIFYADTTIMFTLKILDATLRDKVTYCMYYIYWCVTQMGVVVFMLVVLHVRSSFKAVNDCLKSLLRDMDQQQAIVEKSSLNMTKNTFKASGDNINAIVDPKKICSDNITNSISHHKIVHRIASAYASACGVVCDVDRSYGLILIMILIGIFVHMVTTSYYCINNIRTLLAVRSVEETQLQRYFFMKEISHLYWIIFHAANLVMVIEPCHLTHTEMECTRELVSRLMRRTHSVHHLLVVEVEQFCRQLELSQVFYKPLNITTMTRGLVLTILGFITTYLVILVDISNN